MFLFFHHICSNMKNKGKIQNRQFEKEIASCLCKKTQQSAIWYSKEFRIYTQLFATSLYFIKWNHHRVYLLLIYIINRKFILQGLSIIIRTDILQGLSNINRTGYTKTDFATVSFSSECKSTLTFCLC